MQHARNARASVEKGRQIAKMDVSEERLELATGLYQLKQIDAAGIAKMDVWTVELRVVSRPKPDNHQLQKR
jgi:hypothetical protein